MSSDMEFPPGSQRVSTFLVSSYFKGLKSQQDFLDASELHKLNFSVKNMHLIFLNYKGGQRQRTLLRFA